MNRLFFAQLSSNGKIWSSIDLFSKIRIAFHNNFCNNPFECCNCLLRPIPLVSCQEIASQIPENPFIKLYFNYTGKNRSSSLNGKIGKSNCFSASVSDMVALYSTCGCIFGSISSKSKLRPQNYPLSTKLFSVRYLSSLQKAQETPLRNPETTSTIFPHGAPHGQELESGVPLYRRGKMQGPAVCI